MENCRHAAPKDECSLCKGRSSSGINPVIDWDQSASFPNVDALVEPGAWAAFCRDSRGNFSAEQWAELCAKRGYALKRHNSRGF